MSMFGMGGGSKGGKSTSVPMPHPPPPVPSVAEDEATIAAEKVKMMRTMAALRGRQSTILTGGQLGLANIDRRVALGA